MRSTNETWSRVTFNLVKHEELLGQAVTLYRAKELLDEELLGQASTFYRAELGQASRVLDEMKRDKALYETLNNELGDKLAEKTAEIEILQEQVRVRYCPGLVSRSLARWRRLSRRMVSFRKRSVPTIVHYCPALSSIAILR